MVHTLCSTLRADNTCKDTNFFLNIRKREAEKFAMAGFLVRHVLQKDRAGCIAIQKSLLSLQAEPSPMELDKR